MTVTSPVNNCNTCGPSVEVKAASNFATQQWQIWLDGQKVYAATSTSQSLDQFITTTLGAWHKITVYAFDTAGVAHASTPISVYAPKPLAITTTLIPAAYTNVPYSVQFTATGGTAPYTWSIPSGSLPPGLTMAATTGVVSGTPTQAGTYTHGVRVTDNYGLTAQISSPAGNQLTVTVHNSAIRLTWIWTDIAIDKFNVYRSSTSGGPYTLIGSTTVSSYTDRTFVPGKTYYFVVTTVVAGKESKYSDQAVTVTK